MEWDYNRWPNFRPSETKCKGSGEVLPLQLTGVPNFLDKLQKTRNIIGPIVASSWYRVGWYNNQVSSTGFTGPHTKGRAVDIKIYGAKAFELVSIAKEIGFTRIGIKQHGDVEKRFIHLDDLTEDLINGLSPWIWTYT